MRHFCVYNKGAFNSFDADLNSLLPGVYALPCAHFVHKTRSHFIYTDARLFSAYDALSMLLGEQAKVQSGFRRIGECGRPSQYAGLSLCLHVAPIDRFTLTKHAVSAGFSVMDGEWVSPSTLNVELNIASPCSGYRGYPFLRAGDAGVHAFVLQDALTQRGYYFGGLNGTVTEGTCAAVHKFKRDMGLTKSSTVDGATWKLLL